MGYEGSITNPHQEITADIILYYIILYYIMLYYIILYYIILYYIILYYIILYIYISLSLDRSLSSNQCITTSLSDKRLANLWVNFLLVRFASRSFSAKCCSQSAGKFFRNALRVRENSLELFMRAGTLGFVRFFGLCGCLSGGRGKFPKQTGLSAVWPDATDFVYGSRAGRKSCAHVSSPTCSSCINLQSAN